MKTHTRDRSRSVTRELGASSLRPSWDIINEEDNTDEWPDLEPKTCERRQNIVPKSNRRPTQPVRNKAVTSRPSVCNTGSDIVPKSKTRKVCFNNRSFGAIVGSTSVPFPSENTRQQVSWFISCYIPNSNLLNTI